MKKLHQVVATSTAAALMTLTCGATYALADEPSKSTTKPAQKKAAQKKATDKAARGNGNTENDPNAADPTTKSKDKTQSVTSVLPAEDMAKALVGHGITISDAKYTGNKRSAGTFKGFKKGIGIDSGVTLTSGQLDGEDGIKSSVLGPNDTDASTRMNAAGDKRLTKIAGEKTYDASVLEFKFKASGSKIRFSYVFGSEEYPKYVDQDYNDAFALDVNGKNCALLPGTDSPVTIHNVNAKKNSKYFVKNYDDNEGDHYTQLNGFTKVLKCNATVTPGKQNTIRLAIADTYDDRYDSAVMIKASSVEVQEPPTAKNASYYSYQKAIKVSLDGDDVNPADTLKYSVVSDPKHGKLSGSPKSDGSGLTYTPDKGYDGTDSFTYKVNDGTDDSNTATVKINNKKNSAPQVKDEKYTTEFDTALKVGPSKGVLANDKDADDEQTLTVPDYKQPKHGKVKVAENGSFTYTPDKGFSGKDSFKYSVTDGVDTIDPVATINVEANEPPVGKADHYKTPYNTKLRVKAPLAGLLANDSDPDKDKLTSPKHSKPEHGKVKLFEDGTFRYTPKDGFSGKDTFTYRVSDGHHTSDPVNVTITVGKAGGSSGSDDSDNNGSKGDKPADKAPADKDSGSTGAQAEVKNGNGSVSLSASEKEQAPAGELASTGSEVNPSVIGIGIGALIAGLGTVVAARKLRR